MIRTSDDIEVRWIFDYFLNKSELSKIDIGNWFENKFHYTKSRTIQRVIKPTSDTYLDIKEFIWISAYINIPIEIKLKILKEPMLEKFIDFYEEDIFKRIALYMRIKNINTNKLAIDKKVNYKSLQRLLVNKPMFVKHEFNTKIERLDHRKMFRHFKHDIEYLFPDIEIEYYFHVNDENTQKSIQSYLIQSNNDINIMKIKMNNEYSKRKSYNSEETY